MSESAERTATDERLRTERRRTDDELSRTRAEHDADVDRMLQETRVRMDRVADASRRAVEEALEAADAGTRQDHARIERHEDSARVDERARQDEELAYERSALEHDISTLLKRERGETDERLLQERIRADAAIGSRDDLLAMVSHDLRGMLHGIAMSAALLTKIQAERETQVAILREGRRIERFVVRMNRLVGDLLDVARFEAGKLELVLDPDDPVRILHEAVDASLPFAEAKGITLTHHEPARLPRARYDRERILQVLANLIGNAIKFTERGGCIDVSVEDAGACVRFTVADTGCGIPEEKLALVFERFTQGAGPSRTGLGLGLYISRCIVEAHGGRLWAESHPGIGTLFHFELPTAA